LFKTTCRSSEVSGFPSSPVVGHPEGSLVWYGPRYGGLAPALVGDVEAGPEGRVKGLDEISPLDGGPVDVEGLLDFLDLRNEDGSDRSLLGQVKHRLVHLPKPSMIALTKGVRVTSIVRLHVGDTSHEQLVLDEHARRLDPAADRLYYPSPLRVRLDRLIRCRTSGHPD